MNLCRIVHTFFWLYARFFYVEIALISAVLERLPEDEGGFYVGLILLSDMGFESYEQ